MSAPGPSASPAPGTPGTAYSSTAPTDAGNAKGANGTPAVPTAGFATGLQEYIFNSGFLHQQFADVQVLFFNSSLKLHRLILARSPYLAHLMMSLMPGSTLQLAFNDDNITEEAVYIALQHLYNPSFEHVNGDNARAVLATSYLFGGMPELTQHAYDVTVSALSAGNVGEYVRWLNGSGPRLSGGNGFAFGTATPIGSAPTVGGVGGASSPGGSGDWSDSEAYGEFSARLRSDVLDFLLRTLPAQLKAENADKPVASDPRLLAAYVALPFELFKQCVESPDLPIPFMQDRFAFAKRAIAQRKKAAASLPGPPMEESVVLALKDDGDGMAVHVTRKPKRTRTALWKVEG